MPEFPRQDRCMSDASHVPLDSWGKRGTHPPDPAIATLAHRQHGVVARRQLVDLGLGPKAIEYRVAIGRLHAIHRGVYAVGHRRLTREGARMAAVLVAEGAVLSHRSAAALWGIWSTGGPGST